MLATVADLVGTPLPPNAGEDSYSLLPILLGNDLEAPLREATVHHSLNGMFAIRQGPWKLILGRGSGGFSQPQTLVPAPGEPEGQLYNLYDDPGETTNLYLNHPGIVARLQTLLSRYQDSGRSAPMRGEEVAYRP
jgi:arylsulfatase A